jgi:hypothetical protein
MKLLDNGIRYVGFYNSFIENSIILSVRHIDIEVKWHMAASKKEANIVYYKWDEKARNFEIWTRYTLKFKPLQYVLNVKGYKIKSLLYYICQVYTPIHADERS